MGADDGFRKCQGQDCARVAAAAARLVVFHANVTRAPVDNRGGDGEIADGYVAVPVSFPWAVVAAATPTHVSAASTPQIATYFFMSVALLPLVAATSLGDSFTALRLALMGRAAQSPTGQVQRPF